MPMTVTFRNAMLTSGAALITHIGLMDGGTELSGGSPAYARKSVTWGTASNGVIRPTTDLTFDIPANKTVTSWAGFTALTGGTNHGGGTLVYESFAAQGQYKLIASGTGILASDPA